MTAPTTILVTTKPREKAGPRTGARYAFQAHVSLAKVLEIHETGVDYRAVFDHFDDLALLNGSNNPDEVEFFQIKGKQPLGRKLPVQKVRRHVRMARCILPSIIAATP